MIERSGLRYHIPGIRRSHIRVIDHRNCFVLIFLLFRRTTLAVADRILQVQNCPSENLHTHFTRAFDSDLLSPLIRSPEEAVGAV